MIFRAIIQNDQFTAQLLCEFEFRFVGVYVFNKPTTTTMQNVIDMLNNRSSFAFLRLEISSDHSTRHMIYINMDS